MKNWRRICFAMITFVALGAGAQSALAPIQIVGIGATLNQRADGTIHVGAVIPNAPAEKAGIVPGDEILEVQSRPGDTAVEVRRMALEDVVALIRGPVGVPVQVLIKRDFEEPRIFSMLREEFEIDDGE